MRAWSETRPRLCAGPALSGRNFSVFSEFTVLHALEVSELCRPPHMKVIKREQTEPLVSKIVCLVVPRIAVDGPIRPIQVILLDETKQAV